MSAAAPAATSAPDWHRPPSRSTRISPRPTAATPSEWTAWGRDGDNLGDTLLTGDVNGDGELDLVAGSYGAQPQTVCIWLGPFPRGWTTDTQVEAPSTCIESVVKGDDVHGGV